LVAVAGPVGPAVPAVAVDPEIAVVVGIAVAAVEEEEVGPEIVEAAPEIAGVDPEIVEADPPEIVAVVGPEIAAAAPEIVAEEGEDAPDPVGTAGGSPLAGSYVAPLLEPPGRGSLLQVYTFHSLVEVNQAI